MSILYLFLGLLQFHADTDDSAVLIEKCSSVAKSSSSENNFTEYPNWEQQRNYIQLLTDLWNLDCTQRLWTVGVKADTYTIKYHTTGWAATVFQLKTQYSSRTCGMSFKKVKSRNYAQVEKIWLTWGERTAVTLEGYTLQKINRRIVRNSCCYFAFA